MKLRQNLTQAPKTKLNQTLRSWLPILQAPLDEMDDVLKPFLADNPFAKISPKFKKASNFFSDISKNSVSEKIESLSVAKTSLYETLLAQIEPPLFPTSKSQTIARRIIECINPDGYFEPDSEYFADFAPDDVERVRQRFAYLEPIGVGAKDAKEAIKFGISVCDAPEEVCRLAVEILGDETSLKKLQKSTNYAKALELIKKFNIPPAIDFSEPSQHVQADIFIEIKDGGISVRINDEAYPDIEIDTEGVDATQEFVSSRLKSAKDVIDALDMRKATLYRIGLMLVEYQYEYFYGGDMKPLKLSDIAEELGRSPSTISRAISGKFISSSRGLCEMRQFFTTSVGDEELSNATIKEFLINLIKNETKQKPLSDLKLQELISQKFNTPIVRRTITKYRKSLNIASSSERKREYALRGEITLE
ncbi:RNA polymerase factor sigma-54 [Campylobacter sp. 19-13652]|uniref:RNA polymerase factor sigma-54 n=1 Tax=Campylobacter sp. 19-13652 TaxID=2840180 RepID=UPI001C7491C7|nr:RNA polymerase factor sigma-54 [Campylobacter sp. 19-13652]BCX79828.1 RNA polymerase sigma-54 factor [Campylobacter sp. 19-13652]